MIMPPPPLRPPFALEALDRLPLAEAFYQLWAFLAPDDFLDQLFEQHRGRCYHDRLAFAELVGLLTDALTRHHGSGLAAIDDAAEGNGLPTRPRAVYGKLGRLPLPLAEALLAALTERLRRLFPPGVYRTDLPASLAGLSVVILDGKKIKKVAKRLLATRGRPGTLYGGKVLAAYLPQQGLAVALAADPDGEANDIRLLPGALAQARAAVAGPRLWVADRQFCDLDQPGRFTAEGDHFLVRFNRRNGFAADPARPARPGRNGRGQAYTQEWGWMGAAKDERRRYVRRISLQRPGAETVVLITDLLDEVAYPAEDLLAVYLSRWQIENVYQEITEVFELRHLIGCTPQATVFQASLCLVIYNALQLLRAYAAQTAPEPVRVAELSSEKLFGDLHQELIGLHKVLGAGELLGALGEPWPAESLAARLAALVGRAWRPRWRKAAPKKPRPQQPKAKQSGAHTSVHKVLLAAKRQKDKPTPRSRK